MKTSKKIMTAAAVAGTSVAAGLAVKKAIDTKNTRKEMKLAEENGMKQAYLIGGGLGTLAAAAYMIRDGGMGGENIHILEGMDILGGSNDGAGSIKKGFVCRGGRMLNEETYENFWELFSTIPSLEMPNMSVTGEILNFDHLHPTHAQARLVDENGNRLSVKSMGFKNEERIALMKLMKTEEDVLQDLTIEDWFYDMPHFFETNFWFMWQTTFAFQKWSSLIEFKRYMNRMIKEFSRIDTLEGVTRTPYNQYESVILPLQEYLEQHGVTFHTGYQVTDLDFHEDKLEVTAIHLIHEGKRKVIHLHDGDICIMTNGCMTDCAALGDYKHPAPYKPEGSMSADLWRNITAKKEGLGNPEAFFGNPEQTNWESFTVTCKGNQILKKIEQFSTNIPGSGALMTFKDSSWLMSIVVAAQPHFKAQDMNTTIFWGYGLYTDHIGDYVKKPMRDCTGEELLDELFYHLHMLEDASELKKDIINVIPCMMPYIDSQFQPRKINDRPQVVPEGSVNFAMVSQFVEIPEDMVFTEEYSVRAARIAVYKLLGIDKSICPVTPYHKNPAVLLKAAKTAYR